MSEYWPEGAEFKENADYTAQLVEKVLKERDRLEELASDETELCQRAEEIARQGTKRYPKIHPSLIPLYENPEYKGTKPVIIGEGEQDYMISLREDVEGTVLYLGVPLAGGDYQESPYILFDGIAPKFVGYEALSREDKIELVKSLLAAIDIGMERPTPEALDKEHAAELARMDMTATMQAIMPPTGLSETPIIQ